MRKWDWGLVRTEMGLSAKGSGAKREWDWGLARTARSAEAMDTMRSAEVPLGQRQSKSEPAAFTFSALHTDGTAVCLDQLLGDGQPEPCPAGAAGT